MRAFEPLPQSQNDWLATGKFDLQDVDVAGHTLRTAVVSREEDVPSAGLVVMVGGIPRDTEARLRLPTINKLYAKIALNLASEGYTSILYNQPGTGKSGGDFEEITFGERIKALIELTDLYATKQATADVDLIGMSAGSYMAARAVGDIATRGLNVKGLILQSPAAYPEQVEDLPYNDKFTAVIRSDWNPEDSPIFSDVNKYVREGGKLAMSFFQDDSPPIPQLIQALFNQMGEELTEQGGDVTQFSYRGVAHNFRRLDHNQKKHHNVIDDRSVSAAAEILTDVVVR